MTGVTYTIANNTFSPSSSLLALQPNAGKSLHIPLSLELLLPVPDFAYLYARLITFHYQPNIINKFITIK